MLEALASAAVTCWPSGDVIVTYGSEVPQFSFASLASLDDLSLLADLPYLLWTPDEDDGDEVDDDGTILMPFRKRFPSASRR